MSTYVPDEPTSSVFSVLAINGGIGIVALVLFEWWRNQVEVYAPRLRSANQSFPAKPLGGPFGWLRSIWSVTDDEVLQVAGLDAYVFLRYLRLGLKTATICGCTGLVFLLPIYGTAPGLDGVTGINIFSMANLDLNGSRLWASWIFTYIFTIIFLYLIHKEYEHFVMRRRAFFKQGDENINPQMNFSVIVENIPAEHRSSKKLAKFFDGIFPGKIMFAAMAVESSLIVTVTAERDTAIAKWEQAIAVMEADEEHARPILKLNKKGTPAMCCGKEEVDAIEYWMAEVKRLNVEIEEMRVQNVAIANGEDVTKVLNVDVTAEVERIKSVTSDAVPTSPMLENDETTAVRQEDSDSTSVKRAITEKMMGGTGFVTFNSRCAQATVCQVPVISEQYPNIKAFPAPSPTDLIWRNINTQLAYTNTVVSN